LFGDPALEMVSFNKMVSIDNNKQETISSLAFSSLSANRINFRLSADGKYNLSIIALNGKKVINIVTNKYLKAGNHGYNWNKPGDSKDVFIVRLSSETDSISKRVIWF
jgi:hypothetical protein